MGRPVGMDAPINLRTSRPSAPVIVISRAPVFSQGQAATRLRPSSVFEDLDRGFTRAGSKTQLKDQLADTSSNCMDGVATAATAVIVGATAKTRPTRARSGTSCVCRGVVSDRVVHFPEPQPGKLSRAGYRCQLKNGPDGSAESIWMPFVSASEESLCPTPEAFTVVRWQRSFAPATVTPTAIEPVCRSASLKQGWAKARSTSTGKGVPLRGRGGTDEPNGMRS